MLTTPWHVWISDYAWLIELGMFLALIFIINFFLKRAIVRFKRRAHLKENDWRAHLDFVLIEPVRVLLWILFAASTIELAKQQFIVSDIVPNIAPLRDALIIACLAWFLLRWKKVFQEAMTQRRSRGKSAIEPHSIQVMGKIFTMAIVFLSVLIILQIFGLNVLPLIAFGGVGAAVLGIASKDVVANFFGGLMIHLTRPFTVHELVELPEKKIIGYIEEIGWYFTALRDLHKQPIYIPNSIFSTEVLINQSRMTHRRIEETILIRINDAKRVSLLVEQIREYLFAHPDIDRSQPVYVYAATLTSAAIDVRVKAYTLHTRYEEFMAIKQAVLLKICELVQAAGADFPTTEIVLRQ